MPYLNQCTQIPEPVDCRILTAALDLFVETGYHKMSIHEIQRRANVSIGSIYNHFGGKEGVARALHQHILRELEDMIDRVCSGIDSPLHCCEAIIAKLFEHTETHRNIIAFAFHAKHSDFLPDEPLLCHSAPFSRMRSIVEEAMARGEIREMNPWVATSSVFGGAIRLIQLRLDGVIDEPLSGLHEQLMDAVLGGIVPGRSPKKTAAG